MNINELEKIINEAFDKRESINTSDKNLLNAINETINLLDSGKIRVANKKNENWIVNQ